MEKVWYGFYRAKFYVRYVLLLDFLTALSSMLGLLMAGALWCFTRTEA